MKLKNSNNYNKNDFFDSLINMRALACFAVVVIHSCIFNYDTINNQWWAVNTYNSVSRFAVPMFIMISGSLLINENYSLKDFLYNRALRIIPALIFWSLIYLAWLGDSRLLNIGVIKTIISGPVYYHLWYLYAIMGVIMFSPILSAMYHNSNNSLKLYFLIIWGFTYSIYPVAKYLFKLQSDFISVYELHSFFGLIGWYFLGAYIRDYVIKNSSKFRCYSYLYVFFISSAAIALITYLYSKNLGVISNSTGITSPIFFERNSPLIIINTVSLFIFMSQIKIREFSLLHKAIKEISSYSLGIYCLHLLLLRELLEKVTNYFDNRWISVPALSIIVLCLCIVIIHPIRKIRIARYIL